MGPILVTFLIDVEIPEDEIARTEEPYYVTIDIEGKEYDVKDIGRVWPLEPPS